MTTTVWLDIETRSQSDLVANGLMRYAQHESTQLICMSWAVDDEPVQCWFPEDGPMPERLRGLLGDDSVILYAHNADFERLLFDYVICNDFGLPAIRLTRWRCSSARAMAHGLPGSLMDLCKALDLPIKKMPEGTRLINTYCVPGHRTDWKEGDKSLMADYCDTDVATMRQACSVLRELEDYEWEQYHTVARINDYGVPVDIEFAKAALEYANEIREDVSAQMDKLTEGRIRKATERKQRDLWLRERLTPEQLELITVVKNDQPKIKFDEYHRNLLGSLPDLMPEVYRYIELVAQAGGSTISKYKSMVNHHVDGRVHGSLVWSGAGATGRLSSRTLQLQNMRNDAFDEPEPLIEQIISGVAVDSPADTLGRLIRSAIGFGTGVTYSDYAQIEARVLPWLSADADAEFVLDVFRQKRDIYTENAVKMFGLPDATAVTKDLRQAAKVAVLACGFGGAKNALKAMAKMYGMNFTDDKAQDIVYKWRDANPWATRLWKGLNDACRDAVSTPLKVTAYGRLKFMFDGRDWLWMKLPSGRCLAYFKPKFELVTLPWGDESYEVTCLWGAGKPKAGESWPRRNLSPVVLTENATQAAAADIMREAIVRAHKQGIKVLFSVHDELVVEGNCVDEVHACMVTPLTWADGLPIDAETKFSLRYGK